MKMLDTGNFPVLGHFPDYEPESVGLDRRMETLLPEIGDRAAKILDPQLSEWPMGFVAKIIWLDRNHKEQAKSQIKFVKLWNPELVVPSGSWRNVAGSFADDTARCMELFERCPMLRLRFEDILLHPAGVAAQLSQFVGGIDVNRAAAVVLRRSPKCAPDCEIELSGMRDLLGT